MNLAGNKSLSEMIRYLLVGAFNTLFGYGLFALLNWWFSSLGRFGYEYALLLASLISMTAAFLGYKWFVFHTRGNYVAEWLRCLSIYGTTMLIGLVATPVLVTLLRRVVSRPEIAPYIAVAIMTCVTIIFGFFGHKNVSFREGWSVRE